MSQKLRDYSGELIPNIKWADFTHATLSKLLNLYSKLYMALDGFWYRSVRERAGDKEALAYDMKVWEDMIRYETAMIRRQMKIRGNDITSLMKATQLCPWFQLTVSSIEIESDTRASLTVAYCPTLEYLESKGEGTGYESCTVVCRKINENFASMFGPDIEVRCPRLPPRRSKDDLCCQWQFVKGD